ncbi:hypothetical protein FORC71_1744 [Vibrio parahaemolyticus]|nr:hypothetical protein FORC71_1744 [Vibrio parahaemolyticus]EGQ9460503.1 hypothetical protein [Vibrio parahaemolyticus]OCP63484.1 hypothetical protein AKH08_24480 [Vibrio parahaemolyticus]
MKFIVPFLFAYLGSKLIFSFFNFSYNFISDSFGLINLLIDIGVFVVLWVLAELSYKKFTERSRMTNS